MNTHLKELPYRPQPEPTADYFSQLVARVHEQYPKMYDRGMAAVEDERRGERRKARRTQADIDRRETGYHTAADHSRLCRWNVVKGRKW